MGVFTYPYGMAGTKRVQNVITSLKAYPDVSVRVILQRQASADNVLSGVHEGTPYETVMGDLLRGRMLAALPLLCGKTIAALHRAYQPDRKNIIYHYGPLFLESVVPLMFAKRRGYKIVFDVIEDYELTQDVSRSLYQYLRSAIANRLSALIQDLSSGIVVISSYLEKKCLNFTRRKVPVLYMPISVDIALFPKKPCVRKSTVSLLYAGSFGKKDGMPILFGAFDYLAGKYDNVRLILTGRGDSAALKELLTRIERSPFRRRIEYRGYLDEQDYYSVLNDADIPCMTRVDVAFAQAGFPFKLGEFLATGKPVIASRVSDVDRCLVHGRDAMLVQAGSCEEVCAAAEYLINNPEAAAVMGARGREVAEELFDIKQQGKALKAFLENV